MGRPRLLMLDEPGLGLAPLIINTRAALQAANEGVLLGNGEIVLCVRSSELANDRSIAERNLGKLKADKPEMQKRAS